MNRKYTIYALTIIGLAIVTYFLLNQGPDPVGKALKESEFTELVWSDEFEGIGAIDTTKWFQQTQLPPSGSWYGGLIQHYTDRLENTFQKDGYLHLVAIKETFEDQGEIKEYTSARLNSKYAFTYGRVEVRAKLPEGVGTWPAIWMLSKDINEAGAYWEKQGFGKTNWPICGEIDILEHWGKNPNYIQSAVHTAASSGYRVSNLGGQKADAVSDQFHIYGLEWSKDKMIFSVDNIVHYVYEPTVKNDRNWPFDKDQYILFNIAIEPDIFPEFVESAMIVDYIRVYQ